MSSCSATPKEKLFGTWKCKQLGCKELQKDPEWPSSPMRCTVLNTIPGNCHCCVKELDAEPFIRVARGMFFQGLTSVNGPAPGIKNCPAGCPYKLVEQKDNGKGKLISHACCAFHGDDLKTWPLCPCNVLGNPEQEKQIELLKKIIGYRLGKDWVCDGGPCPDGVTRTSPGDAACPVIRVRFDDLKECPLWRIPAKMLPVPIERSTEQNAEKSVVQNKPPSDIKKEQTKKASIPKKPKKGPRPSLNRCPDPCPYKMTVPENHGKEKNYPQGRCAFTGQKLREMEICPCGVLEEMDERTREYCLKQIRDALQAHAEESFSVKLCHDHRCPDGTVHCCIGDDKQAWVCDAEEGHPPLASLHRCYLARFIPAKTDPIVEKKVPISAREKPKTDTKRESASRKPVAKKKKEPEDPVCEACRERFKSPVPDHACVWCKEEQEKRGRRAWVSKLNMQVVHLGDMETLGKEILDESVDMIFTDPPYIKNLYEQAYAGLATLAARVLKPHGFLITYAPQTHLDEIMDILRYTHESTTRKRILQYFWIISSLNEGRSTAKNHQRNAICLHKPILVFQKADDGTQLKGCRRCFADVVRGRRQKAFHPWQQSIHDVLGIISRFMDPGEILLDPFAGTGTTLIAANLLGMDWIGFEIDPETHAIAVRELQQTPIDLFSFGMAGAACSPSREPVKSPVDLTRQIPVVIKPKKKSGGKKCEELNDVGGCMIKGDCAREELGRIKVGCHVEKSKKKGVKP